MAGRPSLAQLTNPDGAAARVDNPGHSRPNSYAASAATGKILG